MRLINQLKKRNLSEKTKPFRVNFLLGFPPRSRVRCWDAALSCFPSLKYCFRKGLTILKTAGRCVLANISSAGVKSAFVGYGFQPGLQRVGYSSAALSAAGVCACVCQRHQRAIPWFTDMFSWVAEHCRGCILFWLKILLIFMIVFKY